MRSTLKDGKDDCGPAIWPICGFLGGALAGIMDSLWTIVGGVGACDAARHAQLAFVGASVTAAAGAVLGLLIGTLAQTARRSRQPSSMAATRPLRRRISGEAALATLVAAPVLLYDAFALFHGQRAAQIPGRTALALALFAGGTVAFYAAARAFRLLGRARGQAARWIAVAALVAVAVVVHHLDRELLPRLYPWFHATLAGVTLLLMVLATRIAVEALGRSTDRVSGRRARLRATALALGLALSGTGFSLWLLRHSHALRSACYETTRLTAWVLHAIPPSLVSSAVAAGDLPDGEPASASLPKGPRRPDADVVLITVDALRADHVGVYGYERGITTNIDRLARRGTLCERAYAQAPHTSFSIPSMLTGTYFATRARLAPEQAPDSVAVVLGRHGWKTAAFYPPAVFFADGAKLRAYADTHYGFEYVKFEYVDARRRVDQVIAYFDQRKPSKAFVWVHLFEPHEPYEAHAEFSFGGGDVDRYDSEIAYADAAIGRLLEWLGKNRPGAIVVVSSDHGEEFDEHGGRYHGSTLYDEQVRIPLILAVPGVSGRVVRRQVELIDVAATLLGLLGVPAPAHMRGTDLGPWLATPPAPEELLPPAFAEIEDKRMIVSGNEKLICDLNWGFCAYHDLATDPHERRNAADEYPDRTLALRHRLDDWLDDHVRLDPQLDRGVAGSDGTPVPRAIERGRLGDLMVAAELAALLAPDVPAPIRREAAELLVALPARRETAEALARATEDADSVVAAWASVGAVRLGHRPSRERVRRLVRDVSSSRSLRVRGALALGALGDRASVPVLVEALPDCTEMQLCRLVIQQLGSLGDQSAVPALLRHLHTVQTRRETIEALGEIGDRRAAAALVESLSRDEYVPVRVQAAVALAKLNDPVAIPALELAARSDSERTVVAAARNAVATLRAGAGTSATRQGAPSLRRR
ncbi:MAG: sulfatase-like hydrolase/transferase [Deltaproteobacteria bacterium]|nr:sulfatase-like hydrolase/transferase [Deltaproteobacteria bacterium]